MAQFALRPIKESDIDNFHELVKLIESPLASLPNDREVLQERITLSEKSFAAKVSTPGDEYYLFTLEDLKTGKLAGVSALYALTGSTETFFAYEKAEEHFEHSPLNISKNVEVLHFREVENSPAEACSLFMNPEYRSSGQGTLLSFGRYMYAGQEKHRFPERVCAILRGARNEEGKSPFWRALGKVFFEGTLASADTMKSLGHKLFIKDLMPRHPIYVPLLPAAAQTVIQQVHKTTEPAFHMLKKLGFELSQYVDIFDAGPIMIGAFSDLEIIKNRKEASLGAPEEIEGNNNYLIASRLKGFRVVESSLQENSDGSISIPLTAMKALEVESGEMVSYTRL